MTEIAVASPSALFLPATRLDRLPKALATAAGFVVLDLEDAVAAADKASARAALAQIAASDAGAGRLMVRINAAGSRWFEDDLAATAALPLAAIMVPKAESVEALRHAVCVVGTGMGLWALCETAAGLAAARDIARSGLVGRFAFGSIDYAADVGCSTSEAALLHARSELVLASRLAGLPAPFDGVTADFADEQVNIAEARHARELGFGGKLCIHPRQVDWVRAAMRPTDREIAWARAILATSEGVAAVEGSMVDEPVRKRARTILAQSGEAAT